MKLHATTTQPPIAKLLITRVLSSLIQSLPAVADIAVMVLFLSTPLQDRYVAPIVLLLAGAWVLMQAAWCSFMDDTNKYHPYDSSILLPIGRQIGDGPEDIGFNAKRLICLIAGGSLIALVVIFAL